MNEQNIITNSWDKKHISCNVCRSVEAVMVDPDRWDKYITGGLVQDVWPEATPAYREQIIGLRSGYHVCNDCWHSVGWEFDEEEE